MLKFTEIPQRDDKYFISVKDGGYSKCIRPQDYDDGNSFFPGSVLANCVGLACGCFNKNIANMLGIDGFMYPLFNCNAENFIKRAREYYPELLISDIPVPGGMMVWEGRGELAGHVAYVNDFYDGIAYTAESNYGGKIFYNSERKNDNGRWGMSASYNYIGCIDPTAKCVPPVLRDPSVNQVEVTITNLRVRTKPGLEAEIYCLATPGYYNVASITGADGYDWYEIGEDRYIANVDTVYLPGDDIEVIKQLEQLIRDLKAKDEFLTKENKRLTKENGELSAAYSDLRKKVDEFVKSV